MIREARQGLPFTLSPEYLAAQRAYMRYHNMNPIFGISSRLVSVLVLFVMSCNVIIGRIGGDSGRDKQISYCSMTSSLNIKWGEKGFCASMYEITSDH